MNKDKVIAKLIEIIYHVGGFGPIDSRRSINDELKFSECQECLKFESELSALQSEPEEEMYPEEFVKWYVTEGQFNYRFGVGQVLNPLAEAFDYWKSNKTK